MRKCNDEVYQLAKDQALVKKLNNKRFTLFVSPGHSLEDFGRSKIYIIDHNPSWKEHQRQKKESFWIRELQTCVRCNWRQHLQRLSPHGLHWPTVDEGLDTAALTSVSRGEFKRQKKESFWIRELQTLHPEGINKKA
jgi:hypothetical protein